MKNQKKFRYSLNSKAFIIGAVIIVLLLNAILISLNDKIALEIDFTQDKIYALADESKEIAGQIDEPTEILILNSGVEHKILSMVKNVLGNYSQHNSKITVREVNVNKEPAVVQAYALEEANLAKFSLIIRQGDRYEVVNSQDYFSRNGFSYIERLVTTKLANFVDGLNYATILFTKGHGEVVSESNASLLEKTGYKVGQIDILTEDFPAAEDSVVVISCPQVDFSVEEINKLDQYLDQGGNVQIYFDPIYCSSELPNLTNYLSEDWGLVRHTDVVWDASQMIENSNFMLAQLGDHEITAPVRDSQKRAGYGAANSIGRTPEKPANVKIETLLKSYDSAYAKENLKPFLGQGDINKESGDAEGPFDILVAASRENENVAGELHVGHLIVSGSVLIFDALASDTRFANEDILLNSISWMQGGESSITVRAKMLPGGVMSVSKTQFWTWLVILVVVVPLTILAAGIVVFVKRRYK